MIEFNVKIERDDKQTFVFDGSYWDINSMSGITSSDITNNVGTYATSDGLSISSSKLQGTPVIMVASSVGNFPPELQRRLALSFFKPKHEYKIYVTYGDVTRWCWAVLDRFSCPLITVFEDVNLTIQFLKGRYAPNDTQDTMYWRDVDNFAKDVASTEKLWGYPQFLVEDVGAPYDVYNFSREVMLENDGDVPTTFVAIIECDGSVENPKVFINDSYIKIIDTMVEGDIYSLDFVSMEIRKNGVNSIGKMDRESDFNDMIIDLGENSIFSFSADSGENVMKVTVYYDQLYYGVG